MLDWDPASFSFWDWWLYAFAAYSCAGLVWFWFRLAGLEKQAQDGMPEAVARYNGALKGFPNSVFAKMLGKRGLEAHTSRVRKVVHAIRRR